VRGLKLSGLFERMNQLIGMEEALCAFYEEPAAVEDFFQAMADYKIQCIDAMIEHAGLISDHCTTTGA
jgi:uroporphyrinogen decarboxylase